MSTGFWDSKILAALLRCEKLLLEILTEVRSRNNG